MFVPVAAPIVYVKTDDFSSVRLGEVVAGDQAFAAYRQLIGETVGQGYARLVGGDGSI